MAEYTQVGPGLPPLCGERAEILILGSFPSPKSREQGFYYGHPQNRFWPLLVALTGSPVPAWGDLEAKKAMIVTHQLAVWDVIERCAIIGASDASIRDVVPNDVAALTRRLGVRAVVCNGGTAGRLYARYTAASTGLPGLVLPSTSPANASWTLPKLCAAWRETLERAGWKN